jgi:DNA-directed RNA polymerase specialized sigma24 family protein
MYDDSAFLEVLKENSLRLERFFYIRLKELKNDRDVAILSNDLVQATIEQALKNSRKEKYKDKYTVKSLLFLKAKNIWQEYLNNYKIKIQGDLEHVSLWATKELDPSQKSAITSEIKTVQDKISRTTFVIIKLKTEGYNYCEISKQIGISEDAITMRMYRHKKSDDNFDDMEDKNC